MEPTEVVKFTVKARASGQLAVNTFHYFNDPGHPLPGGGSPVGELLAAFVTGYRANVIPIFGSQYWVEEYRAEVWKTLKLGPPPDLSPMPDLSEIANFGGLTPADNGPRIGSQSCLFEAWGVRKTTGLPGKRWRGANRFGPLLEVDVVNSLLVGPIVALGPAVFAFIAGPIVGAVTGVGLLPCVYSLAQHAENGLATTANVACRQILAAFSRPYISSQVTRKLGRGTQ